jgi:class 3 adenylate cyclase
MDFDVLLAQVRELLQRQGRVSYRALKVRFNLDDAYLDALKDELIYARHVALDEGDRVLVWTGEAGTTPDPARQPSIPCSPDTAPAEPRAPEAERRQLMVLFCDLVDSTMLASQPAPEEWREVVQAYQDTCATVIARHEGHIAKYLGDGLSSTSGTPWRTNRNVGNVARRLRLRKLLLVRAVEHHPPPFALRDSPRRGTFG